MVVRKTLVAAVTYEEKPYVTPYTCRKCLSPYHALVRRCPSCGGHYTIKHRPSAVAAAVDNDAPMSSLDAVETSEPRMSTGWPAIDEVFGGGIAIGSVNLLWGKGGAGKTQLLMQIAKGCDAKLVLLIQSEQTQASAMSTVARLDARRVGFHVKATADLAAAESAIRSKKYDLVIVDSLQGLTDSSIDAGPSSIKQAKRVGRRLTALANELKATMLITNHVTTAGVQAGGTFNVHGVDATFEVTGDLKDERKRREFTSLKNRNGPSGVSALLTMTARGLVDRAPDSVPATPESPGRLRGPKVPAVGASAALSPPARTRDAT